MDLKIFHPRKYPRTKTQLIKWWNLKDPKEVFYESVVSSALSHPTRSVEKMPSISSVIRLIAENTPGKTGLGKPNMQEAKKKSKYKLWWKTSQPEDSGAYLAARRQAEKAVSKAKWDRCKSVYDMLDTREGRRVDSVLFSQSASPLNVGYGAYQDR
ncbi:hypothetical protein RB195_006211 [Necator americanus]|uniref:Uncharacterized protein n=1 Tax=Necator americanus TaxID=51031 RepID=A0ABR1BUD7_NECAM